MDQRVFVVAVVFGLAAVGCGMERRGGTSGRIAGLGSSSFVIAEVYAGGGNTGAVFDHDFVVLLNRGPDVASTEGLSLQYTSGSGTATFGASEATRTPLPPLLVEPGAAVLVLGGSSGSAGAAVPLAEVSDATPLALATSSGRLALVRGVEPLGCNGGSTPCETAALERILDRIGWGGASFAEGAPAPAPGNANALVRRAGGCIDADDNASDFVLAAPAPRGSADDPVQCVEASIDAGLDAAVDATGTLPSTDAGVDAGSGATGDAGGDAATDVSTDAGVTETTLAGGIQGFRHRSAIEGRSVSAVLGTVTAVERGRFAMQSASDSDPRTSDGLWVETSTGMAVGVGLRVRVQGTVRERSTSTTGSSAELLTVTTLVASGVEVLGSATVPEAFELAPAALPDSLAGVATAVDLETLAALEPDRSRIDRFESLEGMRVRIGTARVIGPTRMRSDGRRELFVLEAMPLASSVDLRLADPDEGARLALIEGPGPTLPHLDVGDTLRGPIEGVVDYDRGRYVVRVSAHGGGVRSGAPAPRASTRPGSRLRVATFNLHGLSGNDDSARFVELADTVVVTLGAPDLVALQELGDDSGVADDGVVSSERTSARLVDAIVARSGPRYDLISLEPLDGNDGGEPGRNIRVALLVRSDSGLVVMRRTSPSLDILGRGADARLSRSPARLGVGATEFESGRKPLLVELTHDGDRLFVVVVHLRSRLGDPPLEGRVQPASRPSDAVRLAEAEIVAGFLERLLTAAPEAAVVVLGDFNESVDRPASGRLLRAGLVDALAELGPVERTSYVYEGLASSLDQVLVSRRLAARGLRAEVPHAFAGRAFAPSDHDPVVVDLSPGDGIATQRVAAGCGISASRARSADAFVGIALFGWMVWSRASVRARRRASADDHDGERRLGRSPVFGGVAQQLEHEARTVRVGRLESFDPEADQRA